LDVAGFAVVEAIESPPVIGCGPGQVVLSTISVRSDNLIGVRIKGLAETLEATSDHPVYSATRGLWLGIGDLLPGEEIWAQDGAATVLDLRPRPGYHQVFNFEVEKNHVYLVTDLGVLSHNMGLDCGDPAELLRSRSMNLASAISNRSSPFYLSNNDRGPVLSGVLDTRSGEVFWGLNHSSIPDNLHPLLAQRIESYSPTGLPSKLGVPGAHSELYALNRALRAREKAMGRAVTERELSEFMVHNRFLRGNRRLQSVPRCMHCAELTTGVTYLE